MVVQGVLVTLAFLGIFMFPWPLTILLIAVASVRMPFVALLGGVLFDVLYFVPGAAYLPWGIVFGIGGFFASLIVHDFMKTRIMAR